MSTIRFCVIAVARKSSSKVNTIHYKYDNEGKAESEKTQGAEWEEIEFAVEQEEQPTIQIANVNGNAVLVGNSKLIVNNPELFGKYKVGDVIEFIPMPPKDLTTN